MSSSNLANLIFPQSGKMRQISSQGRQVPPEPMAKAIGIGEPGKSVQIEPGETYTVAEIEGAHLDDDDVAYAGAAPQL